MKCRSDVFTLRYFAFYMEYEGLQIVGNPALTVGDTATFTCTTDLPVTRLEWIFSFGTVVETTEQALDLIFNPVNDYLHEREYICRATSANGIQEVSITLDVTSEAIYFCLECQMPEYFYIFLKVDSML